jgi:hypothetical protein
MADGSPEYRFKNGLKTYMSKAEGKRRNEAGDPRITEIAKNMLNPGPEGI